MPAPSSRQIFHSAWRGSRTIFHGAPKLVLIALSIDVILSALTPDEKPDAWTAKPVRLLVEAMSTFLLIPTSLAFYRLLILGEPPSPYASYFTGGRFRRYLAWTAALWLLMRLVDLFSPAGVVRAGLLIGGAVVAFCIAIRLVLLFPALAAGPEDVTVKDAWHDTRGRFWLVVWLSLAVLIPVVVIGVLMFSVIWQLDLSDNAALSFWPAAVRALIDGVFLLLVDVVTIALTSQLFIWFGQRVKPTEATGMYSS